MDKQIEPRRLSNQVKEQGLNHRLRISTLRQTKVNQALNQLADNQASDQCVSMPNRIFMLLVAMKINLKENTQYPIINNETNSTQ